MPTVMVTGHRPPKIGGYDDDNPTRVAIRQVLRDLLLELRPERAISGMALGIDQDFARVVIELGFPLTAALPFPGQERRWPAPSQRRYHALLANAAEVVLVSPAGYHPSKMQTRNEWMVHETGLGGTMIAVFDGSPGGTANCVAYAQGKVGSIIRVNPQDYLQSRRTRLS